MYDDWSSNRSACVGFLYIVVRGLLLSRVTKQSRKGILPFSSISLVNCMSAFVVRPLMILFIFLLSHQFQLKYCLICSVGSYSLRLLDVLIANLHGRPLKGKMGRKVRKEEIHPLFPRTHQFSRPVPYHSNACHVHSGNKSR